MINVTNSYKLIDMNIDGKEKTLKVDPKEAWNVFEVEFDGNTIKVQEGDKISFITENSEIKEGLILKVKGKKEKTKLQIVPTGMDYEIWSVLSIKEGTLKVLDSGNEIESDEDEDLYEDEKDMEDEE